jgi:hypothetical protein
MTASNPFSYFERYPCFARQRIMESLKSLSHSRGTSLDGSSSNTREGEGPMKNRSQLTLAGSRFDKYTKATRRA